MKRLILNILMLLSLITYMSCNSNSSKVCHIVGTLPDAKYNDKYIYLIAENKKVREENGYIDSCLIKNQQFEFFSDINMLQIIRLDYHFRAGIQDLLVVTEPGEVRVTVDSISSGGGTPNNDALQVWKNLTQTQQVKTNQLRKLASDAYRRGDTIVYRSIHEKIDSILRDYRHDSRNLSAKLSDGPFKTFLEESFPTSYKKRMPDGSIKELPFD